MDGPGQADLSRDLVAPHDEVVEVSPVQGMAQVPHDTLQALQEMPPAAVGQGQAAQGVQQDVQGKASVPQGMGQELQVPQQRCNFHAAIIRCTEQNGKTIDLKTAGDLVEDYYKTQQLDVKDYFPLQKPKWNPNIRVEKEKAGKL